MGWLKKMKRKQVPKQKKPKLRRRDPRDIALDKFKLSNVSDEVAAQEAGERSAWLFLASLRRRKGFGKQRLTDVARHMSETDMYIKHKYITFEGLKKELKKETGLYIGEEEYKETMGKKDRYGKVQYQTSNYMSVLYFWALYNLYGWKMTAIGRQYHYCADLSQEIVDGKLTYEKLEKELEQAGFDFDDEAEKIRKEWEEG